MCSVSFIINKQIFNDNKIHQVTIKKNGKKHKAIIAIGLQ